MTREQLIERIEAAELTNAEIVADFVLAKFDAEGEEAAIAELEEAIRNEPTKSTWTVYVVRDASGEYVSSSGDRTPSSDEAMEFYSQEEAQEAVTRTTDRVLSREVSEAT